MSGQHWTPEPWREGRVGGVIVAGPVLHPCADCDRGFCYAHWAQVNLLGRRDYIDEHYRRLYGGDLIVESVSGADRRRIIACVNACAGIPTDALEAGIVATLRERILGIHAACPMPAPVLYLPLPR